MAVTLEDIGGVVGGSTIRGFLGISFNDDGSFKGSLSGASSISLGTNPAATGALRLANADWIKGRNAANSADVNAIRINASDYLELGTSLLRDDLGSGNLDNAGAYIALRRQMVNLSGPTNSSMNLHTVVRGTQTVGDRGIGLLVTVEDDAAVVNKTITNMTRVGTTVTVTSTAHGFANGDKIAVYGVIHTFNAEVNGAWTVANSVTNAFDITVAGLSSGSYTSGGTATNRPMMYGIVSAPQPKIARVGLTGTALAGDDVNCYVAINSGTAKGADAYYLGRNGAIAGSEWTTSFTLGANSDFGIRLIGTYVNSGFDFYGTYGTYAIDFNGGTFTGPMVRLKNNAVVAGRNNAGSADVNLFRMSTADEFQVDAIARFSQTVRITDGVAITSGTSSGSQIGNSTSQKWAFWGATPIIRPSAYTQTFATADKTHAARTSAATATTASTSTTPFGYTTAAQADAIVTNLNAVRADLDDTAQLLNAVVDDLQAIGLVG